MHIFTVTKQVDVKKGKVVVKKKKYDQRSVKFNKADGKGPSVKSLHILEHKFKKEANFQIKKESHGWKDGSVLQVFLYSL